MFWTLPRLGEIGIRIFQHRFLVAMPKLILQSGVPRRLVIVGFYDTFRRILVGSAVWHDSTSLSIQFIVAMWRLQSL
jgi:hypothetical protein